MFQVKKKKRSFAVRTTPPVNDAAPMASAVPPAPVSRPRVTSLEALRRPKPLELRHVLIFQGSDVGAPRGGTQASPGSDEAPKESDARLKICFVALLRLGGPAGGKTAGSQHDGRPAQVTDWFHRCHSLTEK